ncbi:LytR C-terminal domain-containing protein [Microbacterium lacticum]|uniref:LytR C-terminal domain-containing protein n=1 Tax=Microbacterium lacticum TaxID=33885 RepID=UPI0028D397C4|nr:LytR C-terminal domain-containing protein [Microbacterium lacticum]
MPKTSPTKDRFDDLPADRGRVGAHRAENPRIRGGLVLLWSVIATVVLVALGVFGTMLATGRIPLAPSPEPTVSVVSTAEPVIDTSFSVLVLNATPQSGLAAATRDTVIAAGWPADSVIDSDATTDDFPETTIYYAFPQDEGAARGLAQAIGGAVVQLSDAYQPADDPDTADVDESAAKQLVIVLGLDRTDAGQPAATP